VVVVLYSLVVTVILALIVLNTGLLANLSEVKAAKAEELSQVMQEYDALTAEINDISSADYVSSVAENDFGMVKGN
jgi:cell division protein FtsB